MVARTHLAGSSSTLSLMTPSRWQRSTHRLTSRNSCSYVCTHHKHRHGRHKRRHKHHHGHHQALLWSPSQRHMQKNKQKKTQFIQQTQALTSQKDTLFGSRAGAETCWDYVGKIILFFFFNRKPTLYAKIARVHFRNVENFEKRKRKNRREKVEKQGGKSDNLKKKKKRSLLPFLGFVTVPSRGHRLPCAPARRDRCP